MGPVYPASALCWQGLGSLVGTVSQVGSSGLPELTLLDYLEADPAWDKEELSNSPNCPGLGIKASRAMSSLTLALWALSWFLT